MPQYVFGSGTLYAVDSDSNSTPVKFGGLQEASVDFSFSNKELYGQNQFPLTVARGTGKISGKAKNASVSGELFNRLFFGGTLATGQLLVAEDEAAVVPASPGPYTVTVANSVNFSQDLGVIDASIGQPLTKVDSTPAAGQYSVAAGVYTFAAGDAGKQLKVSYSHNSASTGKQLTITNKLQGQAPTFKVILSERYNGKALTLELNACVSSKLSMPTKSEDFMVPEFEFSACADAAGNIGTLSLAE